MNSACETSTIAPARGGRGPAQIGSMYTSAASRVLGREPPTPAAGSGARSGEAAVGRAPSAVPDAAAASASSPRTISACAVPARSSRGGRARSAFVVVVVLARLAPSATLETSEAGAASWRPHEVVGRREGDGGRTHGARLFRLGPASRSRRRRGSTAPLANSKRAAARSSRSSSRHAKSSVASSVGALRRFRAYCSAGVSRSGAGSMNSGTGLGPSGSGAGRPCVGARSASGRLRYPFVGSGGFDAPPSVPPSASAGRSARRTAAPVKRPSPPPPSAFVGEALGARSSAVADVLGHRRSTRHRRRLRSAARPELASAAPRFSVGVSGFSPSRSCASRSVTRCLSALLGLLLSPRRLRVRRGFRRERRARATKAHSSSSSSSESSGASPGPPAETVGALRRDAGGGPEEVPGPSSRNWRA